jgi:hypothetical protein
LEVLLGPRPKLDERFPLLELLLGPRPKLDERFPLLELLLGPRPKLDERFPLLELLLVLFGPRPNPEKPLELDDPPVLGRPPRLELLLLLDFSTSFLFDSVSCRFLAAYSRNRCSIILAR